MEHAFTEKIKKILSAHFGKDSSDIFETSVLLKYLNIKTRSASRGSKSRASFANLYALYVLVEDYQKKGFGSKGNYNKYEGAAFSNLLKRTRELPFGDKLQNHALNHRLNEEFKKFFPTEDAQPILRDHKTNRYWINEGMIILRKTFSLAPAILDIIDEYIKTKKDSFQKFIDTCEQLQNVDAKEATEVINFIMNLIAPNVDARIFEIVSYSILKYFYHNQTIYWGYSLKSIRRENLVLYKTGRTNANDGGIDFVMKPLGRFFQVTETLDFKKYFLDIDKVQRYPITFVIKSSDSESVILAKIKSNAIKNYQIDAIVNRYMDCVEEVINVQKLKERFQEVIDIGLLSKVLEEIIIQSRIEFNIALEEANDENDEDDDDEQEMNLGEYGQPEIKF
jgi:hypothetical protein